MKIENTRARDRRNTAYLKRNNWRVVRIWGHKIKKDIGAVVSSVVEMI